MDFAGEKVARLGDGKFASIDCYRRVKDGTLVALKIFNDPTSSQIAKEREMLASVAGISHYICQIIEHNDYSNFYLVLDPCVGGSLLKHIKQSGRGGLHISVVRGYVSELVSALSAMEKIQCIHRDIKTSNCVLDHNGRLKICDFEHQKHF